MPLAGLYRDHAGNLYEERRQVAEKQDASISPAVELFSSSLPVPRETVLLQFWWRKRQRFSGIAGDSAIRQGTSTERLRDWVQTVPEPCSRSIPLGMKPIYTGSREETAPAKWIVDP